MQMELVCGRTPGCFDFFEDKGISASSAAQVMMYCCIEQCTDAPQPVQELT